MNKKFFVGLVFCVLLLAVFVVADFSLKTQSGDLTLAPASGKVFVNGSIGVGTASPGGLLEVEGSNPASIIDNTGTGSGNFPQLVFRHQGANRGFVYWDEVNDNLLIRSDGGASDGDVTFNTGATNDAMFIRQDGNVGVGTTSPNAKLEVSSVIKSTPTDSPGTCNSDLEGGMYYDASLNEPCFCDGSNWRQFDGGGNC